MTETTRKILSALAAADDGRAEGLPLDLEIYSQKGLEKARAAFSTSCAIETRAEGPRMASLDLTVPTEHVAQSREICGELLNFLLEASVQDRLGLSEERP